MTSTITVQTPLPPWFDPGRDASAALDAVWQLVEDAGQHVVAVELHDTAYALEGHVWTWRVELTEPGATWSRIPPATFPRPND